MRLPQLPQQGFGGLPPQYGPPQMPMGPQMPQTAQAGAFMGPMQHQAGMIGQMPGMVTYDSGVPTPPPTFGNFEPAPPMGPPQPMVLGGMPDPRMHPMFGSPRRTGIAGALGAGLLHRKLMPQGMQGMGLGAFGAVNPIMRGLLMQKLQGLPGASPFGAFAPPQGSAY